MKSDSQAPGVKTDISFLGREGYNSAHSRGLPVGKCCHLLSRLVSLVAGETPFLCGPSLAAICSRCYVPGWWVFSPRFWEFLCGVDFLFLLQWWSHCRVWDPGPGVSFPFPKQSTFSFPLSPDAGWTLNVHWDWLSLHLWRVVTSTS